MPSAYANDPRVVRVNSDRYDLPSPENWRVTRHRSPHSGWGARSDDGPVLDPTDRHCKRQAAFGTADEAIGYVIGEPETGG